MSYQEMYDALLEAIRTGPHEQQHLVKTTDEVFEFLNQDEDRLSEAQILSLRILLAQAETLIGRYFGM